MPGRHFIRYKLQLRFTYNIYLAWWKERTNSRRYTRRQKYIHSTEQYTEHRKHNKSVVREMSRDEERRKKRGVKTREQVLRYPKARKREREKYQQYTNGHKP